MNELENFEVEFQLPEHLREKTKLVVRPLIDLMMETIKTLYPDGEYPENAMGGSRSNSSSSDFKGDRTIRQRQYGELGHLSPFSL